MTRFIRGGIILLTLAGVAAVQDKKATQTFVQNTEEGVEIRAPISPGKDQLWEAQVGKGRFFSNAAVSVVHKIDAFGVDVYLGRLPGKDPMRESWSPIEEIAKSERERLIQPQGEQKEANFKEAKVKEHDDKAKVGALGRGYMQRVTLTDKTDQKVEYTQYLVISSNVLYVITYTYDAEAFKKYFAREGQQILLTIRKCKMDKKKG